jgi:hypothetical protein
VLETGAFDTILPDILQHRCAPTKLAFHSAHTHCVGHTALVA